MPLQAGDAEHLALVQVEIDAGETRAGSKAACRAARSFAVAVGFRSG